MASSVKVLADTAAFGVAGVAGIDGVNAVALGAQHGLPFLDIVAKTVIIVATSGRALVELVAAIKNIFKKQKNS